jgi:hypothetical protein
MGHFEMRSPEGIRGPNSKPNSKPNSTDAQLDTSTIYTPEESLGRPPPAGTPAALTYDLTLTNVDWLQS